MMLSVHGTVDRGDFAWESDQDLGVLGEMGGILIQDGGLTGGGGSVDQSG